MKNPSGKYRRIIGGTAALCLTLAALSGCATRNTPVAVNTLTLLHINDHHSRLDAETTTLRLKNAAGFERSVTVELGGFARVKAAIDALSKRHDPVIKLHAGDATTGDPYFTLSKGEADAALMNTVCFDAFTLGNHEFDNGNANLRKFIDFLQAGQCRTPVLASNLKLKPGDPLQGRIQPYAVIDRDGQKYGIIGVTIGKKILNASRPDPGTDFEDEASAIQKSVDTLKAQGIGRIIVLTHLPYDSANELAQKLSDIDIIVGGDSHTLLGPAALAATGLSPAGDYPTLATNKDGAPVCIVQSWQYAYAVGELQAHFVGDRIDSCSGRPHILIGNTFQEGGTPASPNDTAAYTQQLESIGAFRIETPSAVAMAVLAPFKAAKQALGTQIVGTAAADLCLRRVPGPKRDISRSRLAGCNNHPQVLAHGGMIQQRVAQAFLTQGKAFGGADIALVNAGGVRIDIPAGKITLGDIYALLPFKNNLVRLTMTGDEIKATLEDALESVISETGTGTGAYPYADGLRWKTDMRRKRGARISSLEFKDSTGKWSAFNPAANYRVIVSDFLAEGGDAYTKLKSITGHRREETFIEYADAFLYYLKSQTPLGRPAPGEYSTQNYIETP